VGVEVAVKVGRAVKLGVEVTEETSRWGTRLETEQARIAHNIAATTTKLNRVFVTFFRVFPSPGLRHRAAVELL
jgi:hypothetical protein